MERVKMTNHLDVVLNAPWKPIKRSGYASQSHSYDVSGEKFRLYPLKKLSLFWIVFYSIALLSLIGIPTVINSEPQMIWFFLFLFSLFGITAYIIQVSYPQYQFDYRKGTYKRNPLGFHWGTSNNVTGNISDIIGLQYIQKNYGFPSYELNVILCNGKRFLLMTHGDSESFRESMMELQKFLKVDLFTFNSNWRKQGDPLFTRVTFDVYERD